MAGEFKMLVQSMARRFGYQIRRIEEGVSLDDPVAEQRRLADDALFVLDEVAPTL